MNCKFCDERSNALPFFFIFSLPLFFVGGAPLPLLPRLSLSETKISQDKTQETLGTARDKTQEMLDFTRLVLG